MLCFSDDPELLFIQVPDTLPGEPKEKDIDMLPGGQKSQSASNKQADDLNTSYEVLARKLGLVSLDQFSEGYIGKIQVCKCFSVYCSGKCRGRSAADERNC